MSLINLYQRVQGYITLGLLGTTLIASAGWYITNLKLNAASEKVASCELRYDSLVASYEAAQADYEAKALREKEERERKDREIKARYDARYDDLLAQYRRNLSVYAQTNPTRTLSGDDLSRASGVPSVSDGPGVDPEIFTGSLPDPSPYSGRFVIISNEDADICLINTARAVVTQRWAAEVQESYKEN